MGITNLKKMKNTTQNPFKQRTASVNFHTTFEPSNHGSHFDASIGEAVPILLTTVYERLCLHPDPS